MSQAPESSSPCACGGIFLQEKALGVSQGHQTHTRKAVLLSGRGIPTANLAKCFKSPHIDQTDSRTHPCTRERQPKSRNMICSAHGAYHEKYNRNHHHKNASGRIPINEWFQCPKLMLLEKKTLFGLAYMPASGNKTYSRGQQKRGMFIPARPAHWSRYSPRYSHTYPRTTQQQHRTSDCVIQLSHRSPYIRVISENILKTEYNNNNNNKGLSIFPLAFKFLDYTHQIFCLTLHKIFGERLDIQTHERLGIR